MIIELLNWVWISSALMLLVLALRATLLNRIGAGGVYILWLAIPTHLLLVLTGLEAPLRQPIRLPSINALADRLPGTGITTGNWAWLDPATSLLMVWALGTIAVALLLAARTVQAHVLAQGSQALSDTPAGDSRLPVRRNDGLRSPVVAGLFRPVILVPAEMQQQLSREQIRLVMRHEACHARRRDNLANLIAGLIVSAQWFNPLAWIALRAFRADQELSCDESVLARASDAQRIDYAKALLVLTQPRPAVSPGAAMVAMLVMTMASTIASTIAYDIGVALRQPTPQEN